MSKIEKIILPIYAVDMHEDSPLPFFRDIATTGRGFEGEDLDETDNLTFLVSLSKLFYDNNIGSDIHIIIKNEDYQMISTIVDYKVSYIKSLI